MTEPIKSSISAGKAAKKDKGKGKRDFAAVDAGGDGEDIVDTTKRQFTRATRKNAGQAQPEQPEVDLCLHLGSHY